MEKTILCILAGIICFGAGWFACLKVNTDSIESAEFKRKLIDAQNAALVKAEIVMDNNNLWDADGSDEMVEYMDLCFEVDSLWKKLKCNMKYIIALLVALSNECCRHILM